MFEEKAKKQLEGLLDFDAFVDLHQLNIEVPYEGNEEDTWEPPR